MRNYAGTVIMLVTTMVAAVGSYTINLRVSGERAEVEALRNQLVADAREMRNLQAELRTRARFPELQRWNDNVLQMSAPAAGQFLRSPVELASYAAAAAVPVVSAADRPDVVYAVTAPQTAAPVTAPLVEVNYQAAPAPAARLIRAGYAVPQRMPASGVASEPARPVPALSETQRPERVQLARHEPRPVAPARELSRPEPRKQVSRKAVPVTEASTSALGAPIDLLPQGGQ